MSVILKKLKNIEEGGKGTGGTEKNSSDTFPTASLSGSSVNVSENNKLTHGVKVYTMGGITLLSYRVFMVTIFIGVFSFGVFFTLLFLKTTIDSYVDKAVVVQPSLILNSHGSGSAADENSSGFMPRSVGTVSDMEKSFSGMKSAVPAVNNNPAGYSPEETVKNSGVGLKYVAFSGHSEKFTPPVFFLGKNKNHNHDFNTEHGVEYGLKNVRQRYTVLKKSSYKRPMKPFTEKSIKFPGRRVIKRSIKYKKLVKYSEKKSMKYSTEKSVRNFIKKSIKYLTEKSGKFSSKKSMKYRTRLLLRKTRRLPAAEASFVLRKIYEKKKPDAIVPFSELSCDLKQALKRNNTVRANNILARLIAAADHDRNKTGYYLKLMAFKAIRNQKYDLAKKILNKVLKQDKNDFYAGINMAVIEIRQHHYLDAKKRLLGLKKKYPLKSEIDRLLDEL